MLEKFKKTIENGFDDILIKKELRKLQEEINIVDIVNNELKKLLSEKILLQELSNNKIILINNINYELSLFFSLPKDDAFEVKVIYSYGNDVFLAPLIEIENFNYLIYEQQHTTDCTLLNNSFKLALKEKGFLSTKKIIKIERFKQVLKLDKKKLFVGLAFTSMIDPLNYSWEYDVKTLLPIRIALINTDIGRLSTTTMILNQIGNKKSIKSLEKLCIHKSHIIRWDAVRALINLDFEKGKKELLKMSNDNHLEIKDAANKSLKLLKLI